MSRKARIVRGAVPMNDGMLFDAWAIERPWASVMTQAKSLDSRTIDEKDVRTSDAAASSTIEMSLRHKSSRVIPLSISDRTSPRIRRSVNQCKYSTDRMSCLLYTSDAAD